MLALRDAASVSGRRQQVAVVLHARCGMQQARLAIGPVVLGDAPHLGRQGRVVDAQEMRNLTADQVTPLYREKYWNAIKGDQLPNGVDYLVFDFAVNAGVQKAIQTLQKVLGVKTDGVIGPVTLTAIKEADPEELIKDFTEEKENHYESLSTFETFGEGWMARSERVEQRAAALCG